MSRECGTLKGTVGHPQFEKKPARRSEVSTPAASCEINFINLNARSIVNKVDSLESVLISLEPDFVAVTETWLTHDLVQFSFISLKAPIQWVLHKGWDDK